MKKRRGLSDRGFSRKSRNHSRPSIERFEDRLLLTVFTVTNTSDSNNATANDGSLRGEILASNASTSALPNDIVFSLPSGVQTISVVSALPAISEPVLVDGSTAAGFSNKPLIQISGSLNKVIGTGLTVKASGVTIQDLIIDGFQGDGIDLNGTGDDTVTGTFIGTDPTGSSIVANTGDGILVASQGNQVGSVGGLPNVISGNSLGIQLTGSTASLNTVSNNYIGTDSTGKHALGNTGYGIVVNSGGTTDFFGNTSPGNTIGGVSSGGSLGSGNLVAGNGGGIDVAGAAADSNLITGNFIGTNITGLAALPNSGDGIDLNGVTQTTIGGTGGGIGNVISGNSGDGIQISGSASILNFIQGNDIGVGSDGATSVGNGHSGVVINGASENIVGGTTLGGNAPEYGNTIAYNGLSSATYYGVEILGASNDGILSNSIFGNGGVGIKLNQANAGVQPPTLTSSESGAGQTKITGTYAGSPGETYDLQFFSNQTPNASGAGDGQNFLGDYQITDNSTGNASFTVLLNQAVPVGDYVSATATDGVLVINNTSQFSTNVQNIQAPVTDLQVTTSVPSVGPLFDQPYTYTVTVKNNGQNDDTGVVLTDILPTTATFVSTSAGTEAAGVVTDNIGNLASGASEIVTIIVTPNSTSGTFSNTASVTGDGLDPDLTNNSVTTTGTVVPDSDLAVLITPAFTGNDIPLGSPATYAVTVSNYGPSSADGVVTTITLPASFGDVTVAPDQGSYSISTGNVITVDTGLLGVASSSTILITVTPSATGSEIFAANVSTNSGLADPNPANNSASNTVTVSNAADLGITIDANPDPVLIGQELLYTLTVTNNGPSSASEPVVSDPLPTGLTFVPGDSSAGGNGTLSFAAGVVSANLNPLLSGSSYTVTIAVIPTISGQITNTVTVGDPTLANSVEIDTNPANNSASFTSQISPADISVALDNPADPLFIGTEAVYQVVVTNNGPAVATNVNFTDTFGSGATILNTSAGTINGSTISGNLGSLASGASETITIGVNPTVSGTLLDSAEASTTEEYDPDPNNNSASSSNLVSPVSLGITVTPSASSVLINQPLTYTISVTNSGPATATNVNFTDDLPANVILGSYTTTQGSLTSSGSVISGNLGSLVSGGTATIILTVTPTTVETAVNTVTVKSDDVNTTPSNSTVTTSTSVINLPGSFQFGSSLELVPENAGTITLTVDRTGGSLGAATVDYATSDYTAIAGVNYVSSSGTLTFADGQTTATITIPVLDDGIIDGSHGFFVTLSNATAGSSVGTPSTTGVLVTNTDRDTIPPDVTSLIAVTNGSAIDGFTVTFDKQMNLGPIADVTNYHLFAVGSNGSQTPVPIAGVQYNLSTFAVTIVPTSPLSLNKFYRVVLNGSEGDVLTDTSGNVLFGSSGPNSNYDVIYGQGTNLTYDDALGNKVNINITGGGSLGIYLAADGEAEAVNIMGVVPHKTKISGSVTKLSKQATGYTTIGLINGFGQFGNVYSNLTTPDFYVGSAPVSVSSVLAEKGVTALAVTTPTVTKTVTSKAKTPKGPKVKLV